MSRIVERIERLLRPVLVDLLAEIPLLIKKTSSCKLPLIESKRVEYCIYAQD